MRLITHNDTLTQHKNELLLKERELITQLKKNNSTITELRNKIKSQESDIFDLRVKIKIFNEEIENLEMDNNMLQGSIAVLRSEKESLQEKVETLRSEKNLLWEDMEILRKERQCIQKDMDVLRSDIIEKENHNNGLEQELIRLCLEQKAKEKVTHEISEKLKNAVSSKFRFFDRLMKIYYDAATHTEGKKNVTEDFVAILKDIRDNRGIICELEVMVDSYFDNLITNFRQDYPKLNKYEYDLYLFMVLGFSPKAMSVFQNIETDTFYNRKTALIKKIKSINEKASIRYLGFIKSRKG